MRSLIIIYTLLRGRAVIFALVPMIRIWIVEANMACVLSELYHPFDMLYDSFES